MRERMQNRVPSRFLQMQEMEAITAARKERKEGIKSRQICKSFVPATTEWGLQIGIVPILAVESFDINGGGVRFDF